MYRLIAETNNKSYDMVVSPTSKLEGLKYAGRLSVFPYLSNKEPIVEKHLTYKVEL